MKSFAFAMAMLAVLSPAVADKKLRFIATAVDVTPLNGQAQNATMVKDLEYQHIEAFAGYFYIGHKQKIGCQTASNCYGVYSDTAYDFYDPEDSKNSATLSLAVLGSNQGHYQQVAVSPQGELVFLPLVTPTDQSAVGIMYKNGDVQKPFALTADSPPHVASPLGSQFYACWSAVSDGSFAYKILAKYPSENANLCSQIALNTTVQAYQVPVPEYYL